MSNGYVHNAVVVTDGASTSHSDTMNAANAQHESHVCNKVYAIGVNGTNMTELEATASNPSFVFSTIYHAPRVTRFSSRTVYFI